MATLHGLITTPRDLHQPFHWIRNSDPTGDTLDLVLGGDYWLDTDTLYLYRRTDANDGWETLFPTAAASHTHVAADITDFDEAVDDRAGVLVQPGTGIAVTYDDVANTLTIDNTGALDTEAVDDRVAALLVAGTGVSLTYDDVGNTLTIDNTSTVDDEAIDDRIASLLVAGANITLSYNDGANTLTIAATAAVDNEAIDDRVAALLVAGTGISLVYNDGANTLTIINTGITSNEEIDDRVAALLVAGTGIGLTYNDAGNTLTIANTGITSNEEIDDRVAALLVAGTNVTLTYNDASNTLTIDATGTTDEHIQDVVGAMLVAGSNISIVYDDPSGTVTIADTYSGGFTDPTTTKGDLIVHANSGTTRLAVGTDGQVLVADSSQTAGVKWTGSPSFEAKEFGLLIREILRQQGSTSMAQKGFNATPTITTSTTTAEEDDDGGWTRWGTSSVSGNAVAVRQAGTDATAYRLTRPVQLPDIYFKIQTYTDIANIRLWIGLVDTSPAASSDPTSNNVVAFRYDTGADGTAKWRCYSAGGSASTVTDSGVTIATSTTYKLRIKFTASNSVDFYINGTKVATHTTNLPASSTGLGYFIGCTTLTTAAKNVRFNRMVLAQNV